MGIISLILPHGATVPREKERAMDKEIVRPCTHAFLCNRPAHPPAGPDGAAGSPSSLSQPLFLVPYQDSSSPHTHARRRPPANLILPVVAFPLSISPASSSCPCSPCSRTLRARHSALHLLPLSLYLLPLTIHSFPGDREIQVGVSRLPPLLPSFLFCASRWTRAPG